MTDRPSPGRIRRSDTAKEYDGVLVGDDDYQHYHYAPTGCGRRALRCAPVASRQQARLVGMQRSEILCIFVARIVSRIVG